MIPRGSVSGPPSLPKTPRCGRCGTSVEEGVEYCYVCKSIVQARQAPKASIIIVERVVEKPAETGNEPTS